MRLKWLFLLLFFLPISIKADIKLNQCIDGDTFKLVVDNKIETIRLLSVDTPELNSNDIYGEIASNYTCKLLTNAKKISLLKDNLASQDRYGRLLRWVYVDGKLLQAKLVSKGYAKVAYLYEDYKYNNYLLTLEQTAKLKQVGMWQGNNYDWLIVIIVIFLILLGFTKRDFWLIKKIMLK